jgi:hypothetical protein
MGYGDRRALIWILNPIGVALIDKVDKIARMHILCMKETETMVDRAGSKAKDRRERSSDVVTMFMMKGDPIKALSGFDLPAGAEVAIVSSKPESIRKIRQAGRGRISRIAEATTSLRQRQSETKTAVIDKSAFEPDARSRALLAGVRIAEEDLRAAGGAYDLEQVRTLMRGISRQAVDKRVQEGSLLAVPGPSNRRSYPTLQFAPDGTIVEGLRDVRDALQSKNPWILLNFLARPDARLGDRKPIDLLRSGQQDQVIQAARRHGEQGA